MSEALIPRSYYAPFAEPGRARVLIIDDDRASRLVCASYCDLFDHAGRAVRSIGEALAAMRREAFDIVVLNAHMTGVGGIAALRAIRALPAPAGVAPIVGLMAVGRAEEAQRWRAAGFSAVVDKPVSASRFHAALRAARTPNLPGARSWAPAT